MRDVFIGMHVIQGIAVPIAAFHTSTNPDVQYVYIDL